ncbi:MAG TPA: DUF4129 domain-containing protein [Candidatus Bathyarchaeia archaeon]|nr:DUF4129 domain-containing protein [Candidatus Bathyarchaeia archaeon]
MRVRLLFCVVLLLLVVVASRCATVSASFSVAITIYDHGFVNQIDVTRGRFNPVNKTTTFTQDTPGIYAYVTAALYSANLTWLWYAPSGQLYFNRTVQADCSQSPCTFFTSVYFAGKSSAAAMLGTWRVDLIAGGSRLYSDYFSLTPVITQEDYWNFDLSSPVLNESFPFRGHGYLTVIIHPDNSTWNYYAINLPTATNVTAYEADTHQSLSVSTLVNSTNVLVDLGRPRSDGYKFVLSFDLTGIFGLNSWLGGDLRFGWTDGPWIRFDDAHPIPESYNITLPDKANVVDVVGFNSLGLGYNVTGGTKPSILISTTLGPRQIFGWTILYQDFTWLETRVNVTFVSTTITKPLSIASQQLIPILPLTLGSVSLWSAIMSVFLVISSELLSPIYIKSDIFINRRRLQYVALTLVVVFFVTTGYQVFVTQSLPASLSFTGSKFPVRSGIIVLLISMLGGFWLLKRRRGKTSGVFRSGTQLSPNEIPMKPFVPKQILEIKEVQVPTSRFTKDAFRARVGEEKDPRSAVRLTFRFAESLMSEVTGERRMLNETDSEYCSRITEEYPFLKMPLTRLLEIFEEAEYTSNQIDASQRADAVNAVIELIEVLKNPPKN